MNRILTVYVHVAEDDVSSFGDELLIEWNDGEYAVSEVDAGGTLHHEGPGARATAAAWKATYPDAVRVYDANATAAEPPAPVRCSICEARPADCTCLPPEVADPRLALKGDDGTAYPADVEPRTSSRPARPGSVASPMPGRCYRCGRFAAVLYPAWGPIQSSGIEYEVCEDCAARER